MKTVVLVVALVMVAVAGGTWARPTPPSYCHDPEGLAFCSVLPGQGDPLPPPFADDAEIEVWALQAPVWEFVKGLGNVTKALHLIHTAIGLVDTGSGKEWSFEFEGIFESPNASFPFVVADPNVPGGEEPVWCNAGGVCWGTGIDWSYYTEAQTRLGTTNGTVINKLLAWIPVDNSTQSVTYETFRVMSEWDNGNGHTFLESYTCDDYAWMVFGRLIGWGADFSAAPPIYRVYLNFYIGDSTPKPVNMSDPKQYEAVVAHYAQYNINARGLACAHITDAVDKYVCAAKVAVDLFEWLEHSKYILVDGTYYWLDQDNSDGLSFDWKYAVTPITPIDTDDAALAALVDPAFRKYFV